MSNGKLMNRWLVVVGALLIQLSLGAIYAWSVFTPGLTANTPKKIVDVYGAPQLGLEEADFVAMKENLKAPAKELATLTANAKSEQDADKKKALVAQQGEVLKTMDAIILKYVKADKIEALTYGFTNSQTQAVFAAGLAFFAIIMVMAGRKLPTLGPRKLAMAGGITLGAGYILAGLVAGKSFMMHLLFIGVIGGSGIGLAYVVPIAVAMRWFPDKKGLITGLAVAGFGFGATGWVKLAGAWGHLIADMGMASVFTVYGVAFLAIVLLGSLPMIFPPEGFKPEGWNPPAAAPGQAAMGSVNFTASEMLKTPQFYMIWTVFVFSAGAALMSIGLMKAFPSQALVRTSGLDPVTASAIAGTAMAVFFSLANGLGRIMWGAFSDKLGRKRSIMIMTAIQGVTLLAFTFMAGNEYMLYLGATLIGFNFGGNFALFPTITADTFGSANVGQNYGWVFLAYGFGGVIGPMLGGILGDMGNFPLAFTITGVLCLVASAIIFMVKPATK